MSKGQSRKPATAVGVKPKKPVSVKISGTEKGDSNSIAVYGADAKAVYDVIAKALIVAFPEG